MITTSLRFSFACLCAVVALTPWNSALATANDEAIAAYSGGDYEKAARNFETALSTEGPSAGLYHNLGMALKKQGDAGGAALNFRRAIMLDPRLVDARVALSDLERAKGIPMEPVSWLNRFAEHVPLLPFLVCGFVTFWLGAFFVLGQALLKPRGSGMLMFGLLALALGTALFCVAYLADPKFEWRESAIILATDGASLLKAPAERSESVAKLPAASMVRLVKTNGEWAFAKLPDGKSGWLPVSSLAPLLPKS
jgi:tetratricopeptide (TPR) repeat protein